MNQITTLTPGAGYVQPVNANPTQVESGIGISTQLIIWGMVGFVLLELIAIICLLRYCCRARYLKKRKFKEKEIILSDYAGGTPSIKNITGTNVLETSQTNFGGSSLNENRADMQSITSSRPMLINQMQATDLNDTIMIDDLNPKKITSTNGKPETFDMLIDEKIRIRNNSGSIKHETSIDFRRNPSTDDLYSFRISSKQPIEPIDPNAPIEQYSYKYNGNLNRPAFEIISHADIRPTTPIKFEQAKNLSIRGSKLTRNYSNDFETRKNNNDFLYSERIYSRGSRSPSRSPRKSPSRRGRSFTTPVKLNYGYQESINTRGKPVEWQVARELRTTDWDRLKFYTDNTLHNFYEPTNSNFDHGKYYSINELDRETSIYYNKKKSFKPTTSVATATTITNEYSVPKKKTTLSRDSSQKNLSKSSFMSSFSTNNEDDVEPSKGKLSSYDNRYLLDYISNNSSDISSYNNKLNSLYKSKLVDNSNQISNNKYNNYNKTKSDYDKNSLHEDKWRADRRGHTSNEGKRNSDTSSFEQSPTKPTLLTKIIRDPDTNEILSKTRISESEINNKSNNQLDRNNISIIDITYNNNETNNQVRSPQPFGSRKSDDSTSSLLLPPPPPPPPQFLPDTFSTSTKNSFKSTSNRLSPILSKQSSSSNSDKSSSGTITKHANEDFQPSEILNVNETIYQSKLDSPQVEKKNLTSFNEQSKRILDTIPPKKNLFSEIQSFDPSELRTVKTKVNDSFIYDKINESSSTRSSSVFSSKSPKSPVGSFTTHNKKLSSNNEDKSSLASSTTKRYTHMY